MAARLASARKALRMSATGGATRNTTSMVVTQTVGEGSSAPGAPSSTVRAPRKDIARPRSSPARDGMAGRQLCAATANHAARPHARPDPSHWYRPASIVCTPATRAPRASVDTTQSTTTRIRTTTVTAIPRAAGTPSRSPGWPESSHGNPPGGIWKPPPPLGMAKLLHVVIPLPPPVLPSATRTPSRMRNLCS